jgi:transcription initiation factor IIF auxiliary subunit
MRSWSIEVWLLDDQGNEIMPNVFEKAVYNRHPTFPNPKQSKCGSGSFAHKSVGH